MQVARSMQAAARGTNHWREDDKCLLPSRSWLLSDVADALLPEDTETTALVCTRRMMHQHLRRSMARGITDATPT